MFCIDLKRDPLPGGGGRTERWDVTAVTLQLSCVSGPTTIQQYKNTTFGRIVLSIGCYCSCNRGSVEYIQKFDGERL